VTADNWTKYGFLQFEDCVERWKFLGHRTIPLVSGGLDSTYLLWFLHKELPNEEIIAHHIMFTNRPTLSFQSIALNRILLYLGARVSVEITEVKSPDPQPCKELYLLPMLTHGMLLRLNAKYVAIGDELFHRGSYAAGVSDVARDVINFRKFFSTYSGMNISFSTSIDNLRKEYLKMPVELRNLTWTCREAQVCDDVAIRCGACGPCENLKRHDLWDHTPNEMVLTKEVIHGTLQN
jgi:hypothetical protein